MEYTFVPSYNLFSYNFYNNMNILTQNPFLNSNLIQYKITIYLYSKHTKHTNNIIISLK